MGPVSLNHLTPGNVIGCFHHKHTQFLPTVICLCPVAVGLITGGMGQPALVEGGIR